MKSIPSNLTIAMNKQSNIDSYIPRTPRLMVKRAVESELHALIQERHDPAERLVLKTALFPGRRLRPVLFNLALGQSGRSHLEPAILNVAVSLELGHRASIILDDLIDDDKIRRGEPAFHKALSPEVTPLAVVALIGDAVSRIHSASRMAEIDLVDSFSETLKRMAYGERCDISAPPQQEDPIEYYEDRVLPKTSALFEFLFLAASKLRQQSDESALRLAQLGKRIGAAYQIFNDLHDVAAGVHSRGSDGSTRITYSLLAAISLRRDSSSVRSKLLRRHIGAKVQLPMLAQLQSILLEPDNVSLARAYADNRLQSVRRELGLVATFQNRVLSGFLDWIQQKNCWDQTKFYSAGY